MIEENSLELFEDLAIKIPIDYRIRRCPVPSPLSSPQCKFDKILVVGKIIEQNFILKILVLEITSKKIFLIFLFIRYDTAIIKQTSSYIFWKKFFISLLLQALNEVNQSNIFLVFLVFLVFFLYIWSFKVNRIFIIIRFCFLFSKLNINWFLLFFSFFLKLFLLYLIKVLTTGHSVAKIFMEYMRHCVFLLHYYRIRIF